nr:MAG TPA: Major capsid protein [Caudoviricetes sp.]
MKHMNNFYGGWRIPMTNLQLFAEGDGDGGGSGDGNGDGTGTGDGNGEGNNGNGSMSFDDFLKGEGNQAEFDRRVQKAVKTAVTNAQEKWQALTDDKLSEAEKLAKMTKEERAAYQAKKEREAFEAEKAAFEKEKLVVQVTKELQEKALPVEFAGALSAIADAEKIKEAIAEIKTVWDSQITEAIKAKARQDTPRDGGRLIGNGKRMNIGELAKEARIIKD